MYKRKLPLILQYEMGECGLVCIAMVLGYYGQKCPVEVIRRYVQSTIKGLTLYQLKKIAEHFGLFAEVLRLNIDQLTTLKLPCVLHWDMNHFVVLYKITCKGIKVHDPIKGKVFIPFCEVYNSFTGIVLELTFQNNLTKSEVIINQNNSFTILLKLLKKNLSSILKLVFISCLIQLIYIYGISLIEHSIDSVGGKFTSFGITFLMILFLGTKLMQNSASGIRVLMINTAGTIINYEFGIIVMKHLLCLPISYFQNRHIGDLLSRFGAIEKIRHTVTEGMVEGFVDGIVSIIVLGMMFYINIKITLFVVFFSILYLFSKSYDYSYSKQNQEQVLHSRAIELSHLMESLRSIHSIKIFSKEIQRLDSWKNKFVKSLNATTKVTWHKLIFDSIQYLLFDIEFAITLFLGCMMLSKNLISLGILYAYLTYRQQFITALGKLTDKIADYKNLLLHLERLNDITRTPKELGLYNEKHRKSDELIFDRFIVENVEFAYSLHDSKILSNVNFEIYKGECVAITGPSGCGKSTLLNIMMGLLPPTSGNVYCGDTSIYDINTTVYKKKISAVLQNDVLFSGTILDNISFFDKNLDIELVHDCAKLAGILEEINNFPMKFHTLIGDMGSILSGGQKQRLILARALYAKPQILFLDEATSHLDVKKEREVNYSIKRLGLMVIMIAHRTETIMMADRVVSLI